MSTPEFAIAGLTTGQLNAMVKRLMRETGTNDPAEAVRRYNAGEYKVVRAGEVISSHKLAITKTFNPAEFLFGEGWEFDPTQPRGKSVSIREIDFSQIILTQPIKDGEVINAEERLIRIKGDGKIHLGADQFLAFWENRQFLPEEWRKYVVTFDDDILLNQFGDRYALLLCWDDGEWGWRSYWLGDDFDGNYRSASVAAS